MSKPALGALLLGCGALWLIASHASKPEVAMGFLLGFMIFWVFRRRE